MPRVTLRQYAAKNYGWERVANALVHQLDKTVCRPWAEPQAERTLFHRCESQFATHTAHLCDSGTSILIDLGAFGEVVRTAKIDFLAPRPQLPGNEGEYLVEIGGCTFCHGTNLTGGQGPEPGAPRGTDLTAAGPLSRWSLPDFISTMRNGVTPQGHAINPKYMPWLGYRNMTDTELQAVWFYLRSLSGGQGDEGI